MIPHLAADGPAFQTFDERCIVVAGRRFGEVLLRADSAEAQCLAFTDGGQAMTMSRTFLRSSNSRAMRPASMVLPRPTSSAMNRLTRGSSNALRNGSIW